MALDETAIADAAQRLLEHWMTGRVMPELPEHCRPATRAEGYAIQLAMLRASGRNNYGWKIAATSLAGQSHIGVDGPLAGRIHHTQTIEAGGRIPIAASLMKVFEVEFAFRMARPLVPRAQEYSVGEVMDAVASLHPAIEIPDSRLSRFAKVGAAHLIADNACADRFMLGEESPSRWRNLDLAAHRVTVEVSGREPVEGVGSNVLGDPRRALCWIANELSRFGITLEAGQVVTTGTCIIPTEVSPGVQVKADFGALGSIAAHFI